MIRTLDLGCAGDKLSGAFGVDYVDSSDVDFKWDLNKKLPRRFCGKFDVVHSKFVLDHIGNPLLFLEGCRDYLKGGGRLIIIIDNGDYWRFHLYLGNYHSDVWGLAACPSKPELHHKMMFQMRHITKMLEVLGFDVVAGKYFRDYEQGSFLRYFLRGHLDYLLPKFLGCNVMRIEAVKR